MILKDYTYANENLTKLHSQISASAYVSNFAGLTLNGELLTILGDALLNEAGLDALVAAHDPTEVPESITPRQARQALFLSGVTEAMILGALNSLSDPTKTMALIEWEYSTAFLRANPLVNNVGAALGWTSAQVDGLFILGASL